MLRLKTLLWGLLPVAAVTGIALNRVEPAVEADLEARTLAAVQSGKAGWANIRVAGRDVTLSGDAPSAAALSAAEAAVKALPGVRLVQVSAKVVPPKVEPPKVEPPKVEPPVAVVPEIRPYVWSARLADTLTLEGHVPSDAAKAAQLAAIAQQFGGRGIADRLEIGRGAGENFGAATGFALGLLARMKSGQARLEDGTLAISGEPVDRAAYVALRNAVAGPLPNGLRLAGVDIQLPRVSPFQWQAERGADGVTLSGYVPSDAAREIINSAARLGLDGKTFKDDQAPAAGAPTGFEAITQFALAQLSRLESGKARLVGTELRIEGKARSAADQASIQAALASLPAGFTVSSDLGVIAELKPLPVPPTPAPTLPATPSVPPVATAPAGAAPGAATSGGAAALSSDQAACQASIKKVTGGQQIYFRVASSSIDSESHPFLNRLSQVMLECKSGSIQIEGHTDADGSGEANLELSMDRAEAVQAYLIARGVPEGRLKTAGFGPARPIADNHTADGRARNRRIEFVVMP